MKDLAEIPMSYFRKLLCTNEPTASLAFRENAPGSKICIGSDAMYKMAEYLYEDSRQRHISWRHSTISGFSSSSLVTPISCMPVTISRSSTDDQNEAIPRMTRTHF